MTLGKLYQSLYNILCGKHPSPYPWHFQWLSTRTVCVGTKNAFLNINENSHVLDVGCGNSPYKKWLPKGCSYTGIDVEGGEGTPDIIITPDKSWPLEDQSCDAVLCTEVLEHVRDQTLLLNDIDRILRPNGLLILSVPFLYNEHGIPWDYRRYSAFGLEELFSANYKISYIQRQGAAGTVISTMLLNWINQTLCLTKPLRYIKPLLLPIWLPFCLCVNLFGLSIDALDRTNNFYLNTLVVARKR